MTESQDKPVHRPATPDWELFDRMEFQVVPRYKTSGLSGNEWRYHVSVKSEALENRYDRSLDGDIAQEAVDVANFAMMIADKLRRKRRKAR